MSRRPLRTRHAIKQSMLSEESHARHLSWQAWLGEKGVLNELHHVAKTK